MESSPPIQPKATPESGGQRTAPVEGVRASPVPKAVSQPGETALRYSESEQRELVAEAIQSLTQLAKENQRGLAFALDEVLDRPVITVIDTNSGEVIRKIPTEVSIKIAHNIEKAKGILADIFV